jgi:GNAT superfamily N-acetyltransferase
VALDEAKALAAIAARRQRGVPFDGHELARRIDDLGDLNLSKGARHEAFAELYAAFTPASFRLVPFPDDSAIEAADHRVRVRAVIVDDAHDQVVGEIERDLVLDQGFVRHDLLRIQDAYRGGGLSLVLLNQALPLYRELGLRAVLVHAALQTGRWQWARLGFDFLSDAERGLVMGWATMALVGMGRSPIAIDSPARRLAQLGTGSPPEEASLEDVLAGTQAELAVWQRDPVRKPTADALLTEWDQRALAESQGQLRMLDSQRIQIIAAGNGVAATDPIPVGKAIMLAGPDWLGFFDLADPAAQDAFDREFSRRFTGR